MKHVLPQILIIVLGLQSAHMQPAMDRPWNEEVIYFALTDRFFDGDSANNRPVGSDPTLYDATQTQIDLYHGGDFRGLEIALKKGYFNALGVTAIWITPPVRNVWYSAFDSNDAPKTGYHGYWTQDFLDIDPHLVSAHSLDGQRTYPNSRDGRMQHYKDLVTLAHSKGIKIIQDIVLNHTGPVFYYDANGNGHFDRDQKNEWIRPFKSSGYYENAIWAKTPEWNQRRTEPNTTLHILDKIVPQNGTLGEIASYGRKGMSRGSLGASSGEEVLCDFYGMRDLWTDPGSEHFDALVEDFVEIYAFYIETIGVDGFRIDTVKHVDHEFWDAFSEGLRERLGPERSENLILFGEVYDGNPEALGRYTYRHDWPEDPAPSLDSLLNFQFCYAVREFLRTGKVEFGTAHSIEAAIDALAPSPNEGRDRPFYNQTPGIDGLNSSQKIINFVENHDGINRFRVRGVSERRHLLANAMTLSMPGIPCLYYGSELALLDPEAEVNEDSETGRLTYISAGNANALTDNQSNRHFLALAELIRLRKELPALRSDQIYPLWVDSDRGPQDDGIFAFARGGNGTAPVVVVVNASPHPATTSTYEHAMRLIDPQGQPLLSPGEQLVPVELQHQESTATVTLSWGPGPEAKIQVGGESIHFFQVVHP